MTEAKLATCHCIIGHPSKPKFLVVRHTGGWHPPTLRFPHGTADFKVKSITDGIKLKYGLDTRVLRPLMSSPSYHCLELEMLSTVRDRKLDAVWVDREQYLKSRSTLYSVIDPIEGWLEERKQEQVPALRPPWQQPGWFAQADHWIQFQLDRLGLQATGSLQQFRLGWNASCLLRIPCNEGFLYFKAAYRKPPLEARLSMALADKWPSHLIRPIAVDLRRNWMLSREFGPEDRAVPGPAEFPEFAAAMAKIQVESAECRDEWLDLGCPAHDLGQLQLWIEQEKELVSPLLAGEVPLTEEQLAKFSKRLAGLAGLCRELQDFNLPSTLIHRDFRDDNLVHHEGSARIIDWAGAVVGHPFFVLIHLHAQHALDRAGKDNSDRHSSREEKWFDAVLAAYLEPFRPYGTQRQLADAMELCIKLFPLWKFCYFRNELDWVEVGSPRQIQLGVQLRNTAREMLSS